MKKIIISKKNYRLFIYLIILLKKGCIYDNNINNNNNNENYDLYIYIRAAKK